MSDLNNAGDPPADPSRLPKAVPSGTIPPEGIQSEAIPPAAIPPDATSPGAAAHDRVSGPAPEQARSSVIPSLGALALLVVLAGLFWLWQRGETLQDQVGELQASVAAQPTDTPARLASIELAVADMRKQVALLATQKQTPPVDLRTIDARLDALEHRPAPKPVDLAPLEQRMAALEHRPPPPSVNLAPIEQQLAALQQRPAVTPSDLHALDERLTALEHRPIPPPVDLGPIEQRVAALEKRPVNPPMDPALLARVASLTVAQKTTEQQAQAAAAAAHTSADRTARVQRLQQAAVDLATGKPLGDISDASSALTRFAKVPPPTEAELRLSFPEAARTAAAASEPNSGGLSFTQRMWQRAQELVTVREGGHVIVGAPAAATLASARAKLEAGDLAGAVATLDGLDRNAAQAMQPWRDQAQALLDARSALASAAAAG